jgi:hypothetical protein
MLFGASGPPPRLGREPVALRSFGHPTSGTGTPRLFGRTETPSPAIGRPTCLQARRSVAERKDLSPGGTAPSSGRDERHASAGRAARREGPRLERLFGASRDGLIGTGNPGLFGARSAPSHVEPELFGRTAHARQETDLLGGTAPSHRSRSIAPSGRGGMATGVGTRVYVSRLGEGWSARQPVSAGCGAGQDGNGRRATAAVMRYGCRRGERFEGYEPRDGEWHQSLAGSEHRFFGTDEATTTRANAGKRHEPRPDRVAKHPSPQSGVSRRGGENPRGRNAMHRVVPAHRREVATPSGSGRSRVKPEEGRTRVKTMRGGPVLVQGGSWRTEGEPSPWRTRSMSSAHQ